MAVAPQRPSTASASGPRLVFPQRQRGQEAGAIRCCILESGGKSVLAAGDQLRRHNLQTGRADVLRSLSSGPIANRSRRIQDSWTLFWSVGERIVVNGNDGKLITEAAEPGWRHDAATILGDLRLALAARDAHGQSRLQVFRGLSETSSLMLNEDQPAGTLWMDAFGADAFALGRRDGAVDLWRVRPSSVSHSELRVHTGPVWHGAVAPSETCLVTAADDMTVRIWMIDTEPLVGVVSAVCAGHTDKITGIAITPDSGCVATSSRDGTIRLWGIPDGRSLAVLTDHRDWVTHVAINPAGTRLASCSEDGTIKVWDLGSRLCIGTAYGVSRFLCLAMSADTVVAGDAAGNLWMLQIAL